LGLLIVVVVLAARVQDRDGVKTTLLSAYLISPIRFVFAGKLVDWARTILAAVMHVVRKPEGQHGFAVLPRRWCVERTWSGSPPTAASPATTNATPPYGNNACARAPLTRSSFT
jgi:hypothetical protein